MVHGDSADAFFRTASEWVPPFGAGFRKMSLIPLLVVPSVLLSTSFPWLLRGVLAIGLVAVGYLIVSLLSYRALVAGPATFEHVPVSAQHLGWFGEMVHDAGAQLGIDAWHFSASRPAGYDMVAPGGTAIALLPDVAAHTAIVLQCRDETVSNRIDLRFVSLCADGAGDSTGNTPAVLSMENLDQSFDRVASPRDLLNWHLERVAGRAMPMTLSNIVAVLAPSGSQPNPIHHTGFVRFSLTWAPTVWRRRGITRSYGGG